MSEEHIEVEILDPEKPIAAYNPIRAGIAAMADKYGKTVFSVATTKDMDATKAARAEVRDVRYKVEHIRKALKEPALAYSKRIDDEARQYTDEILAIETPIDNLIKAEEQRKADEKAERERIEREQALAAQHAIDDITNTVVTAAGMHSDVIVDLIEKLTETPITLDQFGNRAGEAEMAKQQTLVRLQEMRIAAEAQEAEQKRLADERAELERQRAEQAKAQAEAKAKADAEEAARQIEIRHQQEALRAQQEEIDRQRREVEAAKAAAEQDEADRLAKIAAEEQAKRDAEARAEQERAETEARAAREAEEAKRTKAAKAARAKLQKEGPGSAEIVRVLSEHYNIEPQYVLGWLTTFEPQAVSTAAAA